MVIIKSPTGETRSVQESQTQGFVNQGWTVDEKTTSPMNVGGTKPTITPETQKAYDFAHTLPTGLPKPSPITPETLKEEKTRHQIKFKQKRI